MTGIEISVKVSLRGAFETCISNYRDITRVVGSMRAMGHDVADLETRAHEAETRLFAFGRIHNLVVSRNMTDSGDGSSELPPYWISTVMTHMRAIGKLQEEASGILERYAPRPSGRIQAGAEQPPAESLQFELPRRPTDSVILSRAQTEYEARSETLQLANASLAKKAGWSFKDRQKLTLLVAGLEKENDALFSLTVPQLGVLLYDAVASRLSTAEFRRRQILDSYDHADEDVDEEARARRKHLEAQMAQLAEARQLVAEVARETKDQKMKRLLDLAELPGLKKATPLGGNRAATGFGEGDQLVVVEWKEYDPNRFKRDEMALRISDVVAIINATSRFIGGHELSSPGFVEDFEINPRGTNRIGVVYRLGGKPELRRMRTLHSLLGGEGSTEASPRPAMSKPALGDRFALARQLATTVMRIHHCGWFHKGLRAENVVFVGANARGVSEPILLGWDYARAGRRGERTETVFAAGSDAELYLHPEWFTGIEGGSGGDDGDDDDDDSDARSGGAAGRTEAADNPPIDSGDEREAGERSRFKAEYDHYQLGCLLLEIGYWKLLSDLKSKSGRVFTGDGWRESWREYMVAKARKLDVQMGTIYRDVVVNLLLGLDADGQGLEFWDAVVLQLSRCRV